MTDARGARGAGGAARPTVGYLGPEGTFSEEALLSCVDARAIEPVPLATIRDAAMAVQQGAVRWALVPIENSVEGSVTVTLDTLALEARDVGIVGETVLAVRHCLIARRPLDPSEIETIVSHPHVPGQCTRFLAGEAPNAQIVAASSTAEAVRTVAEQGDERTAAIGTRLAADLYGCTVLAEGIQDRDDNETRFVWLARGDAPPLPPSLPPSLPPLRTDAAAREPRHKTSLVFWGAGAGRSGWLVRCLDEFARRSINLTKIESRPMRSRMGQYMFFLDLEGALADAAVSEALDGLRGLCEEARVLGSYPAA